MEKRPPALPRSTTAALFACTPLKHPAAEVSFPAGLHGGAFVPMHVVEECGRGRGQAGERAAAPHPGGPWGQRRAGAPTNTVTHVQGY